LYEGPGTELENETESLAESADTADTSSTFTAIAPKKRKHRSWIIENKWVQRVTIGEQQKLRCSICNATATFSYENNATTSAIRHMNSHNITEANGQHGAAGRQSPIELAFPMQKSSVSIHSPETFRGLIVRLLPQCKVPFTYVEKSTVQQLPYYCSTAKCRYCMVLDESIKRTKRLRAI
jgi:hypothetical protein